MCSGPARSGSSVERETSSPPLLHAADMARMGLGTHPAPNGCEACLGRLRSAAAPGRHFFL